jgi:hypothetical protein
MNIVKTASGNVILTDASGNATKVLINVNSLELVSNNEIIIKYGFNQWTSIFVSNIDNTQIEPAGLIPFNGNANDLISLLSGSFFFELSISQKTNFTVNGGTIGGTQPTFSGAPMFYGSYVKIGNVVHFEIQVDFDNILTFGTGQYFVELPFEACCNYQLRDGCIHDISTGRQYSISGHVDNGSKVLTLNYIGSNGRDESFTHNNPFVLNVADNFHIAGTYMVN